MNSSNGFPALAFALGCMIGVQATVVADDWPQLQGNALHSGDSTLRLIGLQAKPAASVPGNSLDPFETAVGKVMTAAPVFRAEY